MRLPYTLLLTSTLLVISNAAPGILSKNPEGPSLANISSSEPGIFQIMTDLTGDAAGMFAVIGIPIWNVRMRQK
jgi:hypothetical protein